MTIPVITGLLQQHPHLRITFVTDKKFEPLFVQISRLEFYGADIHGVHKGIKGLYKLYSELKKNHKFDAIADLHNSLRTRILSGFFKFSGSRISIIDKGRSEKKLLTRKKSKQLIQLKSVFQRYADVFSLLGNSISLDNVKHRTRPEISVPIKELINQYKNKIIGVAPFAKHKEKMYPQEKMGKVIQALTNKGYSLFLFGGGINETDDLKKWEKLYQRVISVAGKFSFAEELELISHLDLMISMDSANMHLASLYGVPVISIWGATHPYAGFYGFGQSPEYAIQVDLYCRPCSVYGNKACYRGDLACMNLIEESEIIKKVEKIFSEKK